MVTARIGPCITFRTRIFTSRDYFYLANSKDLPANHSTQFKPLCLPIRLHAISTCENPLPPGQDYLKIPHPGVRSGGGGGGGEVLARIEPCVIEEAGLIKVWGQGLAGGYQATPISVFMAIRGIFTF